MTALRILLARLLGLFGGDTRGERELRAELDGHIAEATDEYVRQGMTPEEARRQALRQFGGVTQTVEAHREQRSFYFLDWFRIDLRQAVRGLRRTPGFSLVVILVLAIGIAAVTAVFALLNSVILQPLRFPQSDQLVTIRHSAKGFGGEVGLSTGLYLHYLQHSRSLDALAVYRNDVLNLRLPDSGTEKVEITRAGAALFRLLAVKPALGRLFTDEDGRPGFMNTRWQIPILLSHSFWVERFGASPDVLGRVVRINENPREVVGVMPAGFVFPNHHTQIWMLNEVPGATSRFARAFDLDVIARLRPGVGPAAAQSELAGVLPRIVGVFQDATPERFAEVSLSPIVVPLKSAILGDVGDVIWTLFAGMVALLLIAATNATSLFVTRLEGRQREIAVRRALGASRRRIGLLFFVEALLLTGAAAVSGVLLAKTLLAALLASVPIELPRVTEVAVDVVAIAFAALLALLLAILHAGLSLRRSGEVPQNALASASHGMTSDPRGHRVRHIALAFQVALALALMTGSALMLRTYQNLVRTDTGFSADRLLSVEVAIPSRKAGSYVRLYDDLINRVKGVAGVDEVSAASFLPLTTAEHQFPIDRGGELIPFKFVSKDYFRTLKMPVLEGDRFGRDSAFSVPRPVWVSRSLALRLAPGGSALGKEIHRLEKDGSFVDLRGGPVPPFTVAGIVGDAREVSLRNRSTDIVYVPMIEPHVEASIVPTNISLVVRTHGAPGALAAPIKEVITAMDPSLSVGRIRTMESIVESARAREAFVGLLLVTAAIVSLVLGVVGVYGGVAAVVRQRTREIGVRLALGASPSQVVRMAASGSIAAVGAGIVAGLVAAMWSSRWLSSLLFGVAPGDPVIVLSAAGTLIGAALAAAAMAARRAARVPPLLAMRSE